MNKTSSIILLLLCSPFLLGAARPTPNIKHNEVMYKDVTGDGRDEKLLFHYAGADYKSLNISFSIFKIGPEGKEEKKIFYKNWDPAELFKYSNNNYRIRMNMTDFLGGICLDYSKDKMCQTSYCLDKRKYTEKQIKKSIENTICWLKLRKKTGNKKNLYQAIDFDRLDWDAMSKKFGPVTVTAPEIEQVFKELFVENDIPCFSYLPYAKLPKMYIWCPSLGVFISIAS